LADWQSAYFRRAGAGAGAYSTVTSLITAIGRPGAE
jgi:hypothetical protein